MKAKEMKITDLYGLDMTIADLDHAIAQAEMFKGFEHVNTNPEQRTADKERKAYWTDLHDKLFRQQADLKSEQQ